MEDPNSTEMTVFDEVAIEDSPEKLEADNPEPPEELTTSWIERFKTQYLGMVLGLLAGIFYSMSSAVAATALSDIDSVLLIFWRFIATVVVASLVVFGNLIYKGNQAFSFIQLAISSIDRKTGLLILLQSIFWTNSALLFYYGLKYLPYGDCVTITSTSPVGVALLSCVFIPKCQTGGYVPRISIVLTIAGAMVISKPPFLTGAEKFDLHLGMGILFSFGSMILISSATIIINYLPHVHFTHLLLCVHVYGSLQTFLITYFMGTFKFPQSPQSWAWVFFLAILSYAARTLTTLASRWEHPTVVSITRVTEVPWSYCWQVMLISSHFSISSGIGAALILFAVGLSTGSKFVAALDEENKWQKRLKILLR
ncbi:unnamed protein product [Orchesella dallaii]|uniref:EamA domain-containing protein n=1 Tax=Orchesella dallaii TaxID=48710 RepID=A0ABP1R387_9HEXA